MKHLQLLLELLGLLEPVVLSCFSLGLLKSLQLQDSISIQVGETGNNCSLPIPHHFPLHRRLLPVDQESDKPNLVEDIDVVAVVLVEGELEKEDQPPS